MTTDQEITTPAATIESNPEIDLTKFAPSPAEAETGAKTTSPTQPAHHRWRLVAIILAGITTLLLAAGLIYAWSIYQKVNTTPTPSQSATATPEPTPDPDRPVSFLLMGYGGGGHEGGKLTDTMMVVYVQPKLQRIDLISIPRDLWVSFPVNGDTESYWKINAAYALGSDDRNYPNKLPQYTGAGGGGELAKFAVTKVTGLPIDHYGVVDFYSFRKAIDVLGGVDVQVERAFDDYHYPIEGEEDNTCDKSEEEIAALTATMSGQLLEEQFPCRYEQLHFDAGTIHMDGETALKYVRSRHSATDGGDFNRAARQRQLILAIKKKVLSIGFLTKAIPFINSLSDDFHTDMDLATMTELLTKKDAWSSYDIKMTALTTDNILKLGVSQNGQSILMPQAGQDNWPAIQAWLQTQLSDTATNSASQTPSN